MFELLPGYRDTPMTELAMQSPTFGWGSAYALDWNGDGVLDLFHHNHHIYTKAKTRWSDPSSSKVGPRESGCMVDWDAVLRNGTDGTYYAANGGDGFIEWSDAEPSNCFDSHSTVFFDIDGDGYKDLYIVTGGGHGIGNESRYDNLLFWGEEDPTSELGFRLVGGRDAAFDAGLNGRDLSGNQRGRHHYWFDADGNGLIDAITLNDERKDDSVSPARFYKSKTGRKFKTRGILGRTFAEFARMAVLTDIDGDGFAKELVVPSHCKRNSNNFICEKSPRGSLSVYQYDQGLGELRRRTRTQDRPEGLSDYDYKKGANGVATEDLDLDGKPDVAIVWAQRIDFYLSSSRQTRCDRKANEDDRQFCLLYMGGPNASFDTTSFCGDEGARGIRFADFNLDGRVDMLVVCRVPGSHVIYELVASNTWRELQTQEGSVIDYGDLNSLELMLGPANFCDGVPRTNETLTQASKCTQFFSTEQCQGLQYNSQFAICNFREQNGVKSFAPTVADIDNDGYVDLIMGHRYGSMVILRNSLGDQESRNRFLAINVGKHAGPAASIGAILKLTASNMGPNQNETTTQLRVVSTLSHETSLQGGSEDRKIFGLGAAGEPTELKVQWPHCCEATTINGNELSSWVNSMEPPYEVPAPPLNCDRSCFDQQGNAS